MAQTRKFQGTARSIRTDDDGTHYRYHRTDVVSVSPKGKITLRNGGWQTATTKTAMNQASNQAGLGFRVSQRAGTWFVTTRDGTELEFVDGMTF